MTSHPPETVPLAELLARGVTYRQLDYWWRQGWLTTDGAKPEHPGSGVRRTWTRRELAIVDLATRLIRAGVRPDQAVPLARDSIDTGQRAVTTTDGVTITWKASA